MSSPGARSAIIFNDWNEASLHTTRQWSIGPLQRKEAATTPFELLRRTSANDPSAFRILQKFGCSDAVEGICFSSTRGWSLPTRPNYQRCFKNMSAECCCHLVDLKGSEMMAKKMNLPHTSSKHSKMRSFVPRAGLQFMTVGFFHHGG